MLSASVLLALTGCDSNPADTSPPASTPKAPQAKGDATDPSYEILSLAILRAISAGEVSGPYTVLERPTLAPFARTDHPDELRQLQETLAKIESIGPELAAQLIELNRRPKPFVGSEFPSEMPVELMTSAEHQELFSEGNGEGWPRFYNSKSRGTYLISASRPAFDKEHTRAVVMLVREEGTTLEVKFLIGRRLGKSWVVSEEADTPKITRPL